ncbi:MAG: GNAT family N-acetyltransferase [Acutalibacter sp.]|jgi:GNAT superfamily N-acetyltransferase|uniref:GNAT family N-acetyltransferase n=1 Tax=Acutalibacter sp. TaxID=1918636 RepID=UPI0021737B38|nr:GNAT family N-acetyltransferase [Acutalibacter sp.]MCI9224587.1 GNAT family N-acetyltransferase [Acutalibacter sp.]
MTEYRKISAEMLGDELFSSFIRRQEVKKCWRKSGGRWVIKDIEFVDDWDAGDYRRVLGQLRDVLGSGGAVWGAFREGRLKGFASVDGRLIGSERQYAVLAELHVSEDCRRMGMGRELFYRAAESARGLGAGKLYISTMSAVESQAFYISMGCVEAVEPDPWHVEKEPCDVQREYVL